jgi:hypothetical protein
MALNRRLITVIVLLPILVLPLGFIAVVALKHTASAKSRGSAGSVAPTDMVERAAALVSGAVSECLEWLESPYYAWQARRREAAWQLPEKRLKAMTDEELIEWLSHSYFAGLVLGTSFSPVDKAVAEAAKRFSAAAELARRPSCVRSLIRVLSELDDKTAIAQGGGGKGFSFEGNTFMTTVLLMHGQISSASPREQTEMFQIVLKKVKLIADTAREKGESPGGVWGMATDLLGAIMWEAEFQEYLEWKKTRRRADRPQDIKNALPWWYPSFVVVADRFPGTNEQPGVSARGQTLGVACGVLSLPRALAPEYSCIHA